jgi:4-amino-4-deoxy-L-arabinose transferase-like glycosyltransferase
MQKLLPILLAVTFLLASLLNFPDGAVASALSMAISIVIAFFLLKLTDNKDYDERNFVLNIFIGAIFVRILYGTVSYSLDFWLYFAGDAETYNEFGNVLAEYFKGNILVLDTSNYRRFFAFSGTGWGMYYVVAFFYFIVGKNPIAGNMACATISSAIAPILYFLAKDLFNNTRVAKIASIMVAFFPGFINWSSFMMKDGLIILLLCLCVLLSTRLQKTFKVSYAIFLLLSLFGIVALRFYIFPMIVIAIIGGLLVGIKADNSVSSMVRRVVLILTVGLILTYVGIFTVIKQDVTKYGSLESLNRARLDQSSRASSGLEEVDVSTTEGAIAFLPLGLVYLLFAPFPWQITSIRAALTMPEMIVWWLSIPFLIKGILYSLRHRLRTLLPVLIFTLMLTIGYAIFQGNVGTAYRQRTQIQVFYFIFISVGWVVWLEEKENNKLLGKLKSLRVNKAIKT